MKPIFRGKINEELMTTFLKKSLNQFKCTSEHFLQLKTKDNLSIDDIIDQLYFYMDSNYPTYQATVTNIVSGKEVFRFNRRKSARKTFKSEFLHFNFKEISSIFQTIKDNNTNIENIIFDTSHCDLIYYRKGGDFKFHKDTILENSLGADYHFYSILIGLVDTSSGGETLIIHPDLKKVLKFPQSAQRLKYVLFPSDEKHSGSEVKTGIKLCFKFDAWIKFKTHKVNLPLKNYSQNITALHYLLKNINISIPTVFNLILKKEREIMCNLLPLRSKINSDIKEVEKYYHNYELSLEESEELRNKLFTKASILITDNYLHYFDRAGVEDYYDDYEDDNWCNGL